ncbi:alcohol dehydrogenase catalytic domain-containing protein [Tomitella fengzijianii]|uniref:alcohol dehydrogenase n=1 Tax=Tomitella fengzijianii TaxID=2597660 RepID=A0A516WZQ9_9ACTN|nr:alcohol dehydrogenase catalytic domain-containing protein [Tomitella fengzijianii]QDQ96227.1 zinc-binding dehydrogenase [Tomitella fengzijianii]
MAEARTAAADAGSALAQVWHGGMDFRLTSFPLPEPGPGEVTVRVLVSTVCGSDRHTVAGRRSAPSPSILGHESVGEVVAVHSDGVCGVDGRGLQVGDRVVWGVTAACGRCDRCAAGVSAKCRLLRKTGHEPLGVWPLSGGFATHVHLPRGLPIMPVPDAVADGPAALAGCAVATAAACVDAALQRASRPRRALVLGAGLLGVATVAALAAAGVEQIEVRDVDASRVDFARRFGATAGRVVRRDGAPRSGTGDGDLFDAAIDMSGTPGGVAACVGSVDVGGVAVLAGSVRPHAAVPLDAERVVRGHMSIVGVHNYVPVHLRDAVRLLAATSSSSPWSEAVEPPVPLYRLPGLFAGPPARLRAAVAPSNPQSFGT